MRKPDLSHRHNNKDPQTPYQLHCAVDEILVRAESVINLIQIHATNEAEQKGSQPNPEIVYFGLESALHDLKDVRAIISAFASKGAA